MEYTLNCNGRLVDLSSPKVMGILNATPDSFYAGSRTQTEEQIAARTRQIIDEGGSIIDVGACSTRPDSQCTGEADEMARLRQALTVVRRVAPQAVVSVDTFRPDVARMAVEEFSADIINDVGGPATLPHPSAASHTAATAAGRPQDADATLEARMPMFRMVARLGVPYIYMSQQATVHDVLTDCAAAAALLRSLGQKDIVADPGFGFGKTLDQNYQLLLQMERMAMLRLPVLVGVSRKSMIHRLLTITPEEALNGTTAVNTIALLKGAAILRVHDVRQAVECVKIVGRLNNPQTP